MADIIQLLPESIANQIAAGEVIQRPASVAKELLENAIDAGGTHIKLILKDAGKTLLQVIDNGCGMSETDARMSFERHATSKIREAKDLFSIRTMGFRGEALASIAAIAHVEMRTRRQSDELGVKLVIEGSELRTQEPCQCAAGTNIAVKNLFYNVPARRNFLKSNTVEMRHVLDEFQRLAIANPDIFFSLHHNNTEIFHLPPGNLRQRIVAVFGNSCNKKLVPVREDTDVLKLEGFVGKPEFAKKTRGEQLFYVNDRFIKSGYLNHAIINAYEDLLPKDSYPLYVIFIDIDPTRIDINVHPTKQEIKFDDERLVYNYLKVAVRHALGQYSITPTLDFDQEMNLSMKHHRQASGDSEINTGGVNSPAKPVGLVGKPRDRSVPQRQDWQQIYESLQRVEPKEPSEELLANVPLTIESQWNSAGEMDDENQSFSKQKKVPYQIHNSYIISQIKSGFLLVDQQSAHERILYEKYLNLLQEKEVLTQKELFPRTIHLSAADGAILNGILPQINRLGFDVQPFGSDAYVIHGVPADLSAARDEQQIIESLLEQYKSNVELQLGVNENIARSLASSAAIKKGQPLTVMEMQELIDKLFACTVPFKSPLGRNCFITFDLNDLEHQFKK